MPAKSLPVWVWFAVANGLVLVILLAVGGWVASRYLRETPVAKNPNKQGPPSKAKPSSGSRPNVAAAPKESPAKKHADPSPETSAAKSAAEPVPSHAKGADLTSAEIIKLVDGGIVLLHGKNAAGQKIGLGSGFVIDPAGLVATNFHVLRGSSTMEAVFADGKTIQVKGCRAWSETGDLAILELAEKPAAMKVLTLCAGTDRPAAAEVIAIGHPQGFKFTTTTGIISAVHTTAELPDPYREAIRAPAEQVWIQTNAAISGGNSGGPLLNRAGEVIGINTWVAAGQNLGFAVDVRHLVAMAAKVSPESELLSDLTGPDEQLANLVDSFQNQRVWLLQEIQKVQSEEEAKKLIESRHPAIEFFPKFNELAQKHRGKPVAFAALRTLGDIATAPDCPTSCNTEFKRTTSQLLDDHRDDPRLVRLAVRLAGSPLEEAINLARRLSQESSDRKVQAVSLLSLSTLLGARQEQSPQQGEESVKLLEKVKSDYGDVELEGAKLGDIVEPMIYTAKYLSIGRTPPEIEGAELGGEKFRLSDYKGKVVVLDFWADWCPHCVRMYPLERQLVADLAKAPFALLGINCDEPSRLKQVLDQKKVTWRNWSDGPGGPISQTWRVDGYPTLYVLDHEGIIRHINVRDQELVDAVKALLAKVPKKEGAATETPAGPPAIAAPAAGPVLSVAAGTGSEPELRVWTSRDGRAAKFRFLGIDGEKVKLRREDGREVSAPLTAFSDDDQKWVRAQTKP